MIFKQVELEDAQKILLHSIKELPVETISLKRSYGKVIAEDIYAPINVPSFRKSPLDGFALCANDTLGASVDYPIAIQIVDAKQTGEGNKLLRLPHKKGIKVLTGDPLPHEANLVVRKEDVCFKNGEILMTKEFNSDKNVISVGSDISEGEFLIKKGEVLNSYHIGVLSSLGISNIKVYLSSKIAVLSTGSELKLPGEKLEFGEIYNGSLFSLVSLINSLGAEANAIGNVADEENAIKNIILEALHYHDIVITTGGVSVGDNDLVYRTLLKVGAEIFFSRVALKPGSPVVAAKKDGKLIIGLSGNPAAALISYELLVKSVIKKMQGRKDVSLKYLETELVDGFSQKSSLRRFLRVKTTYEKNKWVSKQTGSQQSSSFKSLIDCNALVDIPAGSGPVLSGSVVKTVVIDGGLI